MSSVEPIRGDKGASILGPTNPPREAESPSRLAPPETDHGTMPNLKWSFADSHNRLEQGGWARQTTVRELPIATELAGVNMRLMAGAVRELHWHKENEWAFMLKGRARITAVDQKLRTFQDDVGEGEGWNFPAGIPHSIQGLEDDGCEFLLVFDDGDFDENETFLLTDLLRQNPAKHTGQELQCLGERLRQYSQGGAYIFQAKTPGPLAQDRVAGLGPVPKTYSHRMASLEPLRTKYGRFARWTLPCSRRRRRSAQRWSRSGQGGCENSTGTQTEPSGNIISRATPA